MEEEAMGLKKNSPSVTAGLAVRNGEKYLVKRLENLIANDYQNLVIFISDNASTDQTSRICRSYAKKHKNIKYIRQKKDIGAAKNFEFILKKSKTDYFFFAAHDDLHAPNFVSSCVKTLDKNPQCAACYPNINFIDQDGKVVLFDQKDKDIKISADDSMQKKIRYFMLGPVNWLMYCFFSLKKINPSLLNLTKIFSKMKNEYPWVLELIATNKLCKVNKTFFTYRLRLGTTTGVLTPAVLSDRKSGVEDIHEFMNILKKISRNKNEEKKNRRALLLGALQSYGACKDWYQMTKHWLTRDLLISYLSQQHWDLVFFFLFMKIFKIKPLRILLKQRIY